MRSWSGARGMQKGGLRPAQSPEWGGPESGLAMAASMATRKRACKDQLALSAPEAD